MNKLKKAEEKKELGCIYDKFCIRLKNSTATIKLSLFYNGLFLGVKIKPQPACFPLGLIGIITPSSPAPALVGFPSCDPAPLSSEQLPLVPDQFLSKFGDKHWLFF